MKVRSEGAEFVCTDRQTDGRTGMMEPMVAIRNFANGPENGRN